MIDTELPVADPPEGMWWQLVFDEDGRHSWVLAATPVEEDDARHCRLCNQTFNLEGDLCAHCAAAVSSDFGEDS